MLLKKWVNFEKERKIQISGEGVECYIRIRTQGRKIYLVDKT